VRLNNKLVKSPAHDHAGYDNRARCCGYTHRRKYNWRRRHSDSRHGNADSDPARALRRGELGVKDEIGGALGDAPLQPGRAGPAQR
jgi:hypothetical protein